MGTSFGQEKRVIYLIYIQVNTKVLLLSNSLELGGGILLFPSPSTN